MKTRTRRISKEFVFLLFLICLMSFQITAGPYFSQNTPRLLSNNSTLKTTGEITLSGSVTVLDGDTLEYVNKTIYYDSSETPIFTVYGTLRLINCKIIPLKDPVDFISATQAKIFLENVTFINTSGNSSSIFAVDNSYLYVNYATFSGFYGGYISTSSDVYISNMYANITRQLSFYECHNLTIANSRIDLSENNHVRLLDISSTNNLMLINNTLKIPVEAVEEYSAWLEGISINNDENVIIRGNTVINGGKTLVSYGSSNVLIVNNTFKNEKLVEGTELQIDSTSEDIMIINNSFYNLWEAIEIYAYKNITVTRNFIAQSDLGIKVEPATSSEITDVSVFGNTLINSSFFILGCNSFTARENTIENAHIYIENGTNVTLIQNLLRNVSIDVADSKDIKIINNTIYVLEGYDWLSVDENSTVIEEGNTIITSSSSGGDQSGGETQTEPERQVVQTPMLLTIFIGIGLAIVVIIVIVFGRRKKYFTEI